MSEDRNPTTEDVYLEPQVEAAAKVGMLSRLGSMLTEMKINTILRVYRLASLLLSSVLLLLFPGNFGDTAQLSLIFLVFAFSLLMVVFYEHYWKKIRVMISLILIELFAISILLAFTGGFQGPFLWYALNPFIVATAFFSFALAWLLLLFLLINTFIWKIYLFSDVMTISELFVRNYYPALNLIVIVLIMHMFARMHMTISEQSVEKKSQQKELLSAYRDLSSNYEIFRGLSNFQRQVVKYKDQKGIYSALIDTITGLFPFRQAMILIPPPDFNSGRGDYNLPFQVISAGGIENNKSHSMVLREIEDRWQDLSSLKTKKFIISENRHWIALPLFGENKKVKAVFIGWINQKINPLSFANNLSLFISFAEQTTDWLSMFKQKERVLQHISSIYEAVEAASSGSNPDAVIDLFASYARALTDCDKTVFWMENTSGADYDDYKPVYSVKGPKDIFPEDEWKETLLKLWAEIYDSKSPVVMDIDNSGDKPAQLIGVPVKAGAQCLGLLAGIQSTSTYSLQEIIQTLVILADLGAIAVERSRSEVFAEKLLVLDEQKRIANEIHDTISQNLFSIVYSIDSLLREKGNAMEKHLQHSLADIKSLSADTGRELRALIYRLNPRRDTNESFVQEIGSYLEQTARMNQVEIDYFIKGDTGYLNPAICKTLYRILKESTGNALRHAYCTRIEVQIEVTPFLSELKVSDNGKGFDVRSSLDLYSSGNRLGLVNMRELAIALKGNLNIESTPGRGTEVTCSIPTSPVSVV
ncbi:MAG: ATP-binding protein [Bacillota bacterium]|nr:ATP-binding protein [Bacillota bacterium]